MMIRTTSARRIGACQQGKEEATQEELTTLHQVVNSNSLLAQSIFGQVSCRDDGAMIVVCGVM